MKKQKTESQQEVQNEVPAVVNETEMQLENVKGQLARALADYENLRKRVERERGEMVDMVTMRFVSKFLPIFDMMTDAQKHLADPGLGISLKVLADTLKEEGIVEIEVKSGMMFDHTLHEAIDTIVSEEHTDGEISEVVLAGYRMVDGPVIRYAKVKVYKQN